METQFEKILKVHSNNPAKKARFIKFNKHKMQPHDRRAHLCIRCNRAEGHIKIHGLNYCRQCFREVAPDLGFKKYGKEA
jgi:small subunit ribosomal protein S14